MIDPRSTTRTSVPAAPAKKSEAAGTALRLPLLSRSSGSWSVGAVLLVGLVAGLTLWDADPSPEFLAAAFLNSADVRLDGVSCLSIGPQSVEFDRKPYSDPKLIGVIAETLSIKTVLLGADYATCPWHFFVTVVPRTNAAIRYNGISSKYLVSIGICERNIDGSVSASRCLSKNVYVFNPRVEPFELFSLALIGLAKPHASEWEAFQRKK